MADDEGIRRRGGTRDGAVSCGVGDDVWCGMWEMTVWEMRVRRGLLRGGLVLCVSCGPAVVVPVGCFFERKKKIGRNCAKLAVGVNKYLEH